MTFRSTGYYRVNENPDVYLTNVVSIIIVAPIIIFLRQKYRLNNGVTILMCVIAFIIYFIVRQIFRI